MTTSSGTNFFFFSKKKKSFILIVFALILSFFLLKDDLHFMKLAIEQANLSEPVETAYCVGAVNIKKLNFKLTTDIYLNISLSIGISKRFTYSF